MSRIQVRVKTNAEGEFSKTVKCQGLIEGIELEIGTLAEADVTVTEVISDITVASLEGVTEDTAYRPLALQHDTDGVELAAEYDDGAMTPGLDDIYGSIVAYGQLLIEVTADPNTNGSLYIRTA